MLRKSHPKNKGVDFHSGFHLKFILPLMPREKLTGKVGIGKDVRTGGESECGRFFPQGFDGLECATEISDGLNGDSRLV